MIEKAKEKFWSNVTEQEPDECWPWEAGTTTDGYGVLQVDGERIYAHRLSLELEDGDLGEKWALHECDNPTCVNPSHLYAGTREDNMQDAVERTDWGSYNRGEDHGQSELTEEDVREIRRRYEEENVYQQELADEYGVSQMNISRIVRGERWSHM